MGTLGYQPAGGYAATVTAELDWLVSVAERDSSGTAQLPAGFDHDHFAPMLDYAAEDDYLAER